MLAPSFFISDVMWLIWKMSLDFLGPQFSFTWKMGTSSTLPQGNVKMFCKFLPGTTFILKLNSFISNNPQHPPFLQLNWKSVLGGSVSGQCPNCDTFLRQIYVLGQNQPIYQISLKLQCLNRSLFLAHIRIPYWWTVLLQVIIQERGFFYALASPSFNT